MVKPTPPANLRRQVLVKALVDLLLGRGPVLVVTGPGDERIKREPGTLERDGHTVPSEGGDQSGVVTQAPATGKGLTVVEPGDRTAGIGMHGGLVQAFSQMTEIRGLQVLG